MCKEFGALPFPGSVYQQPYGAILRMEAVLNAMHQVDQIELKRARAREANERKAEAANGS